MEDEEKYQRELNIRKIVITSIIAIFLIAIIVIFSLYIAEESFRKWVDVNVLRKDIASENVASIDLNVDKNNQIFCYNKYICILNEKNLKLYNQSGENITDISVDINTALFSSNDKYLAIAEKNGQEFCVITDKSYSWRQKVDGEILQIYINKNGYVALVTTDTTYKSIIYSKEASTSKMILKVQYQDKNNLVCVYDDGINIVKDGKETEVLSKEDGITFMSGNLNNNIAYIKEEQVGAFESTSKLSIVNPLNGQTSTYNFDEIAKEMYTNGNIIGVNIGTEMYFIGTNGMLIKKYTSNQEITNVMITKGLAIIIYKDRIEIVNL